MTDTVIDDWIDKMSCRIINAYIHGCRNEVRRSQLQIRQDDVKNFLIILDFSRIKKNNPGRGNLNGRINI